MGVEEIVEKIINDAKKKAQKVKREAAKEARKIKAEVKEQTEKLKQDYLAQNLRIVQVEKGRILTQARLEQRNFILSKKQELLEKVFNLAQQKLSELPKQKKLQFLKKVILKASESGDEEIIFSPIDRELVNESFLKSLNKDLKKLKGQGRLRLSKESRSLSGGVILKKGNFEINASLENLLRELREKKESDIIRLLTEGK
jgi:V/A-type H+-transporting ATPase subunit E